MTRHINTDWKAHVAGTGVTCYTCHRGKPVPDNVWFDAGPPRSRWPTASAIAPGRTRPRMQVGLASLPYDPFTSFLAGKENIRVVGNDRAAERQPAARSSRPSGPTG